MQITALIHVLPTSKFKDIVSRWADCLLIEATRAHMVNEQWT